MQSCEFAHCDDIMEPKNLVTQEDVDEILDNAPTQEHVFWGKELVVSYRLSNGLDRKSTRLNSSHT